MNDNTILRIKVPAHLYESVKEQLSLTEAKKQNFGAGWSVVKEKKAPKKEMEKVEEIDYVPGSNPDIDDETASAALSGIKEDTTDKIEKALQSPQVVSALKTLNAYITNRADWAKVVKGLGKKLSSGEGAAFDKAIQSNTAVKKSDQQLGALSGEKIQMSEVEEGVLDENAITTFLDAAKDLTPDQIALGLKQAVSSDAGVASVIASIVAAAAKIGNKLTKQSQEQGTNVMHKHNW